jgi:hypothetical protein
MTVVVGPIDWGAHDPDMVERVLSVMLLQERPRAWRRERSRGDGGVDVADVVEGGHEVFQIKSFTGALTSARKRDIKKSFESALAGGSLNGRIVAWRLLLPMDPSKEAEKWFRELTEAAPFQCEWLGKSRVDLLAANNPHVIDYYLRDGRGRIEQRYRDLLRTRDIIDSADTGPRAAEITEGLRQLLEGLNRDDPHYAYAFEASHDRPPVEAEMRRPGLVMTMTECIADRGCVSVRVFARHRHAMEERPVEISFNVAANSDAHVQLQRSMDYGSTAELEDGSLTDLSVSAPGGLAIAKQTAGARVWGHSEEGFVPFILSFAVVDEDGEELARTTVAVTDRRSGARGRELTCVESGGAFSLKLLIANPAAGNDASVSLADWEPDYWGRPAAKVQNGIALLSHLNKPNALIVSLEPGGRHMMTLGIGQGSAPISRVVREFVDDLSALQQHCPATLNVPTAITTGDVRRVHGAAQLVAGTIIDRVWDKAEFVVDAEAVENFVANLLEPHAIAVVTPLTVTIGDQDFELGNQLMRFTGARVEDPGGAQAAAESAASGGTGVPVSIVPVDDAPVEIMWVGPDDKTGAHSGDMHGE